MEDRMIAKKYYDLNARVLFFRNSKEYFIGERITRYINLIKGFHIGGFLNLFFEDTWRVIYKKKKNPLLETLDFSVPYGGTKIAIYTAVYGNYDIILEPLYKDPMCDYYIFTDQDVPENSIWKKRDFTDFPIDVKSNFLKNRYIKMLPHKVLPEYDYSVYIDGNLQITSEISLYFKCFNPKSGIAMHKHPSNTGIYEEVKYNCRLGKITEAEAKMLKQEYKSNGMPEHFGMFECNVICRRSCDPNCIQIMEKWWEAVKKGVKRDQLYFTYILYLTGYKFCDLKLLGNNINANPMFIRYKHN